MKKLSDQLSKIYAEWVDQTKQDNFYLHYKQGLPISEKLLSLFQLHSVNNGVVVLEIPNPAWSNLLSFYQESFLDIWKTKFPQMNIQTIQWKINSDLQDQRSIDTKEDIPDSKRSHYGEKISK